MANDTPDLTRRTALQKCVLAVGGLTLGTAAVSGTAAADSPERMDLSGQVIEPHDCIDERIRIVDGMGQQHVHSQQDGGGGMHLNVHVNAQGVEGVGVDSSRMYRLSYAGSDTMNVKPPYPSTETLIINITVASQGPADNELARLRSHITVNANGEITAHEFEQVTKCRG